LIPEIVDVEPKRKLNNIRRRCLGVVHECVVEEKVLELVEKALLCCGWIWLSQEMEMGSGSPFGMDGKMIIHRIFLHFINHLLCLSN
jgi:hypothetical protein